MFYVCVAKFNITRSHKIFLGLGVNSRLAFGVLPAAAYPAKSRTPPFQKAASYLGFV